MPNSIRAALAYLGVTSLLVGVWALFLPADFYATFPGGGRVWIAADGPFNEHLVRDVGGLSLGVATLAFLALWRPRLISPFAVGLASLAYNLPHFVYHLSHLSLYQPIDRAANVVALGAPLAASLWLVRSALSRRERTAP